MLLQAALPCLLMAPDGGKSEIVLKGGTDAAMAPPVWYYQHVCLPLLRKWWGLEAELQVPAQAVVDWSSCCGLCMMRLAQARRHHIAGWPAVWLTVDCVGLHIHIGHTGSCFGPSADRS